MELEGIRFYDITQTQNHEFQEFSFICETKNIDFTEVESRIASLEIKKSVGRKLGEKDVE